MPPSAELAASALPAAEAERLMALARYRILDSEREQAFDDLAILASEICGTPIAVVNLIGDGRQFFKAEIGLGVRETPLESSFCRKAILEAEFLYVPDATLDPRFDCNPLVTGEPGLRFYAGALLRTAEGHAIGTVCVLDLEPRELTQRQQSALKRLARQAMAQLELRRALHERREEDRRHAQILESAVDYAIVTLDLDGVVTSWNEGACRILGWTEAEMLGRPANRLFTEEDVAAGRPEHELHEARTHGRGRDERWHRRRDGSLFFALGETMPLRDAEGEQVGYLKILRDRTEQRAAAASLEESEHRFKALTELAPTIIWFGDTDGGLSYLNDRWYAYTGQSEAEALPLGWIAAIHPDDREALHRSWDDARAAGAPYETEARFRRQDGAYRWFLIRAELLRDESGTVAGWLGSNADIHDRRSADEALLKAEDQLRLAIAATNIGIFDYDLVTGNLDWTARVYELFGLPADAPITYDTFLEGLHPDDREWADEAVRAALDPAGSGGFDVEYRTVGLTDGIERWVAARGQAVFASGRTTRFVGTVRDVTASRRAGEELRAAEERYRLAARATNDAIWDWDLVTDGIRWNEAVQRLFGYAPEAVGPGGSWWTTHIHPDDRERIGHGISAVIQGTGEHWSDEYRFVKADGSYADILDRGYVIRDAHGTAVRMIGAMLDITQRKRAEEHQRLLTSELQHRVKNTLALVQAIASQSFRNAVDLDAAREAFASRLISLGRAHDILTQSSWTQAPMMEVVEGALSVHRQGAGRIRVLGPNLLLGAKPALSIAMAMHELATNATKYGALSNESGTVELGWAAVHDAAEPRLSLTWTERGGPPVTPPTRKGFGSRMIERSFAADFSGSVLLSYEPSGLTCRLEAPLSSLQEQQGDVAG